MSPWEILMLLCFGASWPFNLLKTWRNKSAVGKSFVFLILVVLGYIAGIIHKILYKPDSVLILWIGIVLLVIADLALCLYYKYRAPAPAMTAAVEKQ